MHPPKLTLTQLRALTKRMNFNQSLGIRVMKTHEDGVTIEISMREDLRNGFGMLHGGVSATIADVAVGMAVARHFGGARPATTVELKINYFRPVQDGKVSARGRLLRVGQHLVIGSVEMRDGENNVTGFATVTYMLLPQPAEGSPANSAKLKG